MRGRATLDEEPALIRDPYLVGVTTVSVTGAVSGVFCCWQLDRMATAVRARTVMVFIIILIGVGC